MFRRGRSVGGTREGRGGRHRGFVQSVTTMIRSMTTFFFFPLLLLFLLRNEPPVFGLLENSIRFFSQKVGVVEVDSVHRKGRQEGRGAEEKERGSMRSCSCIATDLLFVCVCFFFLLFFNFFFFLITRLFFLFFLFFGLAFDSRPETLISTQLVHNSSLNPSTPDSYDGHELPPHSHRA